MTEDQSQQSIWVVSELYYPEETSTGYFVTEIAERLAQSFRVRAVCGQPNYSARGVKAPRHEVRHGVEIDRCWATTFDKDILPLRLVNMLTISMSFFLKLVLHLRRDDRVLVLTNPPTTPFVAAVACRIRGTKCLLSIHDVYPDAAIAAGIIRRDSWVTKLLNVAVRWLYGSVSHITVLGRDVAEVVNAKLAPRRKPAIIIPCWADTDVVFPTRRQENRILRELGLLNKFVVQYAGNMGAVHDIELIVEAAKRLRGDESVHFLMAGSGAKRTWLEQIIQTENLKNMTLLPRQPRDELVVLLNACDVAIVALIPGMRGVSVPSRLYNILAAGKPIVAVSDKGSEAARVVAEERIGWLVAPADVEGLVAAIRQARSVEEEVASMGRRARLAAETMYDRGRILDTFVQMIALSFGETNDPAKGMGGRRMVR